MTPMNNHYTTAKLTAYPDRGTLSVSSLLHHHPLVSVLSASSSIGLPYFIQNKASLCACLAKCVSPILDSQFLVWPLPPNKPH